MSDLSELDRLTKQNEVADVLRRAKALIADPEKWTKHALERDGAYCVVGAIKEAQHEYSGGVNIIFTFRRAVFGNDHEFVSSWNNARERTHADVMSAFDRAIELAERGRG